MEFLITALTLGFLGSMHCVGMCGPIALALPVVENTRFSRISGIVLYNLGRATTYGMLGMFFGLLGKSFVIAGYQQALSITLGVVILCIVIIPDHYLQAIPGSGTFFKPIEKVRAELARLFKTRSYGSLFTIGILNGMLPCGLVYTGVAGAIAMADPLRGSLFMMFFGLGTMPAMLGLTIAGQKISMSVRNSFKKVVPVFVSLMAVLLILRGLNLGIPYVSPELSKTDCTKHHCCHK
jgi:uncharacterized protein